MAFSLKFQNLRLVLTVIFIQLLFHYGSFSSFAVPMLIATICFELPYLMRISFWKVYKLPKLIMFIFLFAVIQSTCIAIFLQDPVYARKILLSSILLLTIFMISYSHQSMHAFPALKNFIFVMHIFVVIDIIGIGDLIYGNRAKPLFPFTEVSHFAVMYCIPVLIVFPSYNLRKKLFTICLLCGALYLNLSATLLAVILLIIVSSIGFKGIFNFFALCIAFSVFTYFILTNPYFYDRFLISQSSSNLSVLTYFSGLEAAFSALISAPLGYGFQGLGLVYTSGVADELCRVHAFCANKYDGGFFFAKLVSEFGYIGLGLVAWIVYKAVPILFKRKMSNLNVMSTEQVRKQNLALASLGFFVELFVRGVGYFSPSLILYSCILFVRKFKRPK